MLELNQTLISKIRQELNNFGLRITGENLTKPWGAYFLIDENDIAKFIHQYFPHLEGKDFAPGLKLSPKILVVGPHLRLSWQYHHRRQELWRVVSGPVEVVRGPSDELPPGKTFNEGEIIEIALGERHRLVGLDDWGVVAEIWLHTDPEHPSDEDDIVRVEDDFVR